MKTLEKAKEINQKIDKLETFIELKNKKRNANRRYYDNVFKSETHSKRKQLISLKEQLKLILQ